MPKKYLRVLIPDKWEQKNHHNNRNWKNIIYYSERKKMNANDVVNQYERCASYQKDTFYKVQSLSRDPLWDFYRILKPFPSKNIGVKTKPTRRGNPIIGGLTITRFPPDKPKVITFQ